MHGVQISGLVDWVRYEVTRLGAIRTQTIGFCMQHEEGKNAAPPKPYGKLSMN